MAVMKGELAEAFQYADESLRRDGTFIVHLIEKYGKPGVFIKHAHQEIFGDRSFVDKLLATADGYAPEILKRTKALNSNRDFILQVAKKYGIDALEYASDDLKKSESFIVQYLQETKDTSVLRKLPSEKRGNARIMSEAVKINPSIFEVASNELKADPNIAILAVRGDPTLYYEVRYPAYREYDIIMAAAKEYPLVLRNLKEEDYEKVSPQVFLDALAKSPSSFGAPEKLMKDRDFMERALNIADLNLSLLHKDLQNDPTFMKKMIDLFVSKNREQLYLNRHPITELPASVATLRNLRSVDLEDCSNLKVLPANLHAREYIGLSRCSSLTSLPENMKTHTLYIHGSGITELPESLVATEVICKKGQLKKIPAKFKGKILEY